MLINTLWCENCAILAHVDRVNILINMIGLVNMPINTLGDFECFRLSRAVAGPRESLLRAARHTSRRAGPGSSHRPVRTHRVRLISIFKYDIVMVN